MSVQETIVMKFGTLATTDIYCEGKQHSVILTRKSTDTFIPFLRHLRYYLSVTSRNVSTSTATFKNAENVSHL